MVNDMTQNYYEQLGGTYREENGNLVPDVELPEQKSIGKYGRMHLDYLKQHRRGRYSALLGEDCSTPTLPTWTNRHKKCCPL